jgi:diguanylate cyclase (GGDEF)-like protein
MSETVKTLVLEDNPADARLMKEWLGESREPSFDVRQASTLGEALEVLRREPFDLVMTDLNLPDEEGLQTFYKVQEAAREAPVMVMTGLNDRSAGERAVTGGAEDYVVKGRLDHDEMLRAVLFALERHRQRQVLKHQAARLKKDVRTLAALARTDPLTELQNRRGLEEALRREQAAARRLGERLTACLIDVDDFKRVNDVLGHDAGDRVLQGVARAIQACLRATDYAARAGGDEFVVLLPRTLPDEALAIAERIRERIASFPGTGLKAPVTASIGLVAPPAGRELDLEGLLQAAHGALVRSKAGGKNRVTLS